MAQPLGVDGFSAGLLTAAAATPQSPSRTPVGAELRCGTYRSTREKRKGNEGGRLHIVHPSPTPSRIVGHGMDDALEAGMRTITHSLCASALFELPGQMVTESERHGAEGLPLGFAKGLGMIVAREVTGVYEFVTAPVPAPRDYRPVLEPEYPWDHFRNL